MTSSNHLLPFAHNQSRPANELALSTNHVPSGTSRKREFPASDSLDDGWPSSSDVSRYDFGNDEDEDFRHVQHNKRFHQFTSDFDEKFWEMPASSPPPPTSSFDPDETLEGDVTMMEDEEDHDSVGIRSSQNKGSSWIFGKDSLITRSISTAQTMIQSVIDEGKSEVNLDSLQLTEVPEEISDLKDLVILNDNDSLIPKVKIFLSNNQISSISPCVFEVRNITVLSLRNNLVKEIPPAIAKLTNLVELSVGGNMLEYLPAELLKLPKLANLSIHPNPFKSINEFQLLESDGVTEDNENNLSEPNARPVYTIPATIGDVKPPVHVPNILDHDHIQSRRYFASVYQNPNFSKSLHHDEKNPDFEDNGVATLVERTLRVLANHVILTERERRRLDLDPHFETLIKSAIAALNFGQVCGVCSDLTVLGVGHAFEWWDGIKGNREVVLKRVFCSVACYRSWEREIRNELDS